MTTKKKNSNALKKARVRAGYTQKELADKLGIHENYYARVERGEENPSLETLKKLTKILKIKSSDILSF